ncbi:MAG: hypothetical protein CMG55_03005 [Candidatus Marinimicrobia bacterium]|nr:hypothetical protein [Candidatus Neomarinimicrobiota bacterium]
MKILYPFLVLLLLINVSCVENIIFIQVYPDGQAYLKIVSIGDSTDIHDNDFEHPLKNKITGNSSFNIIKKDSLWKASTEVIFKNSTFDFNPKNGLAFNINNSQEKSTLSTFYNFKMEFISRLIKQNYPLLYDALKNNMLDSLKWLPEAMTVIINKSLFDLESENIDLNNKINRQRLVNHFKNSFARITTFEELESIQKNRMDFIQTTIKPFRLDKQFAKNLAEKMEKHENYLKASLGLKDDSFIIKLLMPGEMLSANALSMNQDTLVWKFGLDSLLNDNYILSASSIVYSKKKVQKTSILIVCFLLIFGIILIYKQKKL